ncbi:Gfo/Idh/MocA family protein [Geodermatophilus sp. SYSU D01045]
MRVAIVGCGYVFDHYMATWPRHPELEIAGVTDVDRARAETVAAHYGLRLYAGTDEAVADPTVDIVVNLTSIPSHDEVTRAALEAGKHVYSEKPLTTSLERARELVDLAERRGLRLACAPSNPLSDTVQTLRTAVGRGAVGDVRLVYAEFDDNPIYLMQPETWRSATGAPWPYRHEYEAGCTWEHAAYHLAWMCALFGPVRSVTAFSKRVVPDKTDEPLEPADTPDFSVAALDFASGVVGRLTCSIAAPLDHRMRIIGNRGVLSADTYRNYRCPVRLEHFTPVTLNARKSISVRTNSVLQWLLGVGGSRLGLVTLAGREGAADAGRGRRLPSPREALRRWRRYELGQQDKVLGISELARGIATGGASVPPHDFTLHLTELTLAIQAAGTSGGAQEMTTTFAPLAWPEVAGANALDLGPGTRQRLLSALLDRRLTGMHAHRPAAARPVAAPGPARAGVPAAD